MAELELIREIVSTGGDAATIGIMLILWRLSNRLTIVETKLDLHGIGYVGNKK
ncbi:MAG: hypothetical protein IE928_10330 [Gammaproteobacteria bacterium]|nr:hypothetical protein [Gammaproteobacteria bacterium]